MAVYTAMIVITLAHIALRYGYFIPTQRIRSLNAWRQPLIGFPDSDLIRFGPW